jgi:hypothetical protein
MNFHDEISAIRSNWTGGRITKRTAIIEFEALLREHRMLPKDHLLNPDLSDESFLSLLNHSFALTEGSLAWLEQQTETFFAEHPITESRCPACNRWVAGGLYKQVGIEEEDDGDQIAPREIFDLPSLRCAACAQAYLDERVFKTKSPGIPDTGEAPMSKEEASWFASLEKQMNEPNGKK